MSGTGSRRSRATTRATRNVSTALKALIAENNEADREQFGSNSNNSARMKKNLATLKSKKSKIPQPPTPPKPSERKLSFNYNPANFENAPASVPAAPEHKLSFNYNPENFNDEEYDEKNCQRFSFSDFCQKIVRNLIRENNFARYEVPADGNCFFYSLRAWVLLTGYQGTIADDRPLRALKPNEMRKYLVSYGKAHPELIQDFYAWNNSNTAESKARKIRANIGELNKDKAWAVGAGDFVPLLASHAFRLNIKVHNVMWSGRETPQLVELPAIYNEVDPNIANILRINDNHYDLLLPVDLDNEVLREKFEAIRRRIRSAGGARRTRRAGRR